MSSKSIFAKFTCFFCLVFLLSACAPAANATPTSRAAALRNRPTRTPAAPTALPATLSTSLQKSSGWIIFSMADGLYSHLFIYDPNNIPPTRLTDSDWDDEDPALSPDGSKLAYSSSRGGEWDIYILNLHTGDTQQFTQTKKYDGSPAWSPDGQYLVYQTLDDSNLDLIIQSTVDPNAKPIQLTSGVGDNFDPAWSPDGKTIAFVTNRSGQNEHWLANLQSAGNRFTKLMSNTDVQYRFPRWSPDGSSLAWCKQTTESSIEVMSLAEENPSPKELGFGCNPVWSTDGTSIIATLEQPNSNYFIGYQVKENTLFLSPLQTTGHVGSFDWVSASTSKALANFVNLQNLPAPTALFSATLSLPAAANGRKGVVALNDVQAPHAYLADTTDESFYALRKGIGEKSGWDFLASLENAYLPLTATSSPGITQNWLYTGRAIDVNTVPINAGWMAVSREDFNGQTFWRVWIKCLEQTGSCGKPMLTAAWDFSARFDSDPVAYENGGKLSTIPDGYWIDFTEFASRYGWERNPSQSDWRYYYSGILFNQFVFRQELSWQEAMLEIYPPDSLQTPGTGN